ncbi:hypothetical protein [Halopelagius longus]|uniref:Uncharacterized protein n=1 Tax=Halopelagius longus TaxID=1236180 RepID=A0A1H0Y056_9EURY|nr:hypothetical protein [Halopelagius longus]RDI72202.1 hypothetical protein DWB78_11040 [Halopelagius longus]SDQ08532.1 hypothetical protein SAMN05216278_0317 [Halopelagius longus]
MVPSKRILVVAAVSAAWSVVGTEAFETLFALDGPPAPAAALAVLLVCVVGYGFSHVRRPRTTAVLCFVAALSFVVGFVAFFAWSAATSFPDAVPAFVLRS